MVKKEEDADEEDAKGGKEEVKSNLPMATQRLVELIFNENHFSKPPAAWTTLPQSCTC